MLEVVRHYFQNISRKVDAVWREQARIQLRSKLGTLIKQTEAERINFLAEQYRQIADWAEEFGAANNDTKKMILARIIDQPINKGRASGKETRPLLMG